MIAIGIVLNLVGLGIFCWLLFTLAVYALPFFVGATTGVFAYHSAAGRLVAIAVGLLTGGATLGTAPIFFRRVLAPCRRITDAALCARVRLLRNARRAARTGRRYPGSPDVA